MKRLAICLGALFAAAPACADDVSADLACRFKHAVVEVDSPVAMPGPMTAFLESKTGEMAPRGGAFNSTDVIEDAKAPGRRFIRAGHSGDRWFVWYEHGGIAYSKNIVVLAPKAGNQPPQLLAHLSYFRENPCALTDAVLDGRTPPAALQSGWW